MIRRIAMLEFHYQDLVATYRFVQIFNVYFG